MRRLLCAATLALVGVAAAPPSGTTPFVFDGNRMYAKLAFLRPDGSAHRALAFVHMGSPAIALRASLFADLQLDQGQPLVFTIGGFRIQVPAADVVSEPRTPSSLGVELKVEAILPARVLKNYQVALAVDPGTIENLDLFDWYSQKNAGPVVGWIGANVLKAYRITIDYPSRVMYWQQQGDPDTHDLDQVGPALPNPGDGRPSGRHPV